MFFCDLHLSTICGPGSLLVIIVMIEGGNINADFAIFYLYSTGQDISPDFRAQCQVVWCTGSENRLHLNHMNFKMISINTRD